jgi:transposase
MNIEVEPVFTAFIGIDWADTKHDICVQAANVDAREFSVIPHKVEDIEQWAQAMYARFGGPIAVAVELSKGPIVYALQKFDFFVIFPINPSTLAKYREAFTPSRAKDDPTDAELALDLLIKHPERFKPLNPQSKEIRALAILTEHRRKLVNDKIRITNRIRNTLKQYYPQILEWFDRIDTPVFCDFVKRWPSLVQVKQARKTTLSKFFHDHNMRRAHLLEQRLTSIKSATPLTEDDGVIIPNRLQALVLVDLLHVTLASIRRYDDEIASIATRHSDYDLFASLPGAGPSLAPRLLVAFGEQRERFNSADELQKYSGVAPVTERSGKKHWVHWRWQCPTFLRQTFVEWAAQTINKSFWAGAFYRQQRDKGCTHQAAVRALAFKWIRILFRCWKTHTPYNESVYLKALKRRGSPLMNQVAPSINT